MALRSDNDMNFLTKPARRAAGAAAAFAILACSAPAFADTPLSIQLGPTIIFQQNARDTGGTTQVGVGANYDVGPRVPIVPIRGSVTFDYSGGANGNQRLSTYGFGVAGRLTTPFYAGAGIGVYFENATLCCFVAPGAPNSTATTTASATAVGTNFFLGERLFTIPGGSALSLQATYQQRPSFDGVDPSGLNVGLRLQF